MFNPHARNAEMSLLHPVVRQKVAEVVAALQAEGIPFRVFEAYRFPERQADLFAQGRTKPGPIVTKAPPWRSYHQFGLAVDLVLHVDGQWSWDTAGAKRGWWKRMQELGQAQGLEALSFELPHLQLAGTSTDALVRGDYPGGGDDDWAENLDAAIMGWSGSPAAPPRPGVAQRPAIA